MVYWAIWNKLYIHTTGENKDSIAVNEHALNSKISNATSCQVNNMPSCFWIMPRNFHLHFYCHTKHALSFSLSHAFLSWPNRMNAFQDIPQPKSDLMAHRIGRVGHCKMYYYATDLSGRIITPLNNGLPFSMSWWLFLPPFHKKRVSLFFLFNASFSS